MIMLLAASPWFGEWRKPVMLLSIIMFSMCMTAFAAAWFPLLDGILMKEDRGGFFGMLRFSWQRFATLFCFICGLLVGENPKTWMLHNVRLPSSGPGPSNIPKR